MKMPPASVAVILPAWHSEETIAASLESLACQDYPSVQLIVVESDPSGPVEALVRSDFPTVRYIASDQRLLPHAARNLGAQSTDAGLLLFTDPDIYVPPRWVSSLVEVHEQYGGVVIGALDNATHRWLDWGIHLCKFDIFLPMGRTRPFGYCATGNMLCARPDFEKVGGFDGGEMLGDLLIGWKFAEQGIPITFAPQAAVQHHHMQAFPAFLRERWQRGRDFGRLRKAHFHWTQAATFRQLLITISGLRLASLLLRTGVHAWQAGDFGWFAGAFPVLCLGHCAWLLGEIEAYST